MKQLLLCAALTATVTGNLCAQSTQKYWIEESKTTQTFEVPQLQVNIRDYVYLKKGARMIIELANADDYAHIRNVRNDVHALMQDIAFYKDSLEHVTGCVRIDRSVVEDNAMAQYRFSVHPAVGDIYVHKDEQTAHLKLEQDTVRLIYHVYGKERTFKRTGTDGKKHDVTFHPQHTAAVTFCVDRYTDLEELLKDSASITRILDTLSNSLTDATKEKPYKYKSTAQYRNYESIYHFRRFNGLLKNEYGGDWNVTSDQDKLTLDFNVGVGLIRNYLMPMGQIGISLCGKTKAYYTAEFQEREYNTFVSLSVSPYFYFDKGDDGKYYTHDNWFVNFSAGSAGKLLGTTSPLLRGGVGYLMRRNGDIFRGTTMKGFMDIQLRNGFTLCPEIIATDNFKVFFPAVTVKLLGF